MMIFRNWVSTLASAESFVAVTRVGTLVIVSSLVWQTLRADPVSRRIAATSSVHIPGVHLPVFFYQGVTLFLAKQCEHVHPF